MIPSRDCLIRIRPRASKLILSRGGTVAMLDLDGWVKDATEHGVSVRETRVLSRYEFLVDGRPLEPAGVSMVEQHALLAYYIAPRSETAYRKHVAERRASTAQHTIELRLTRFVGGGMRDRIEVTNFNQRRASLRLRLDLDADFSDIAELGKRRRQHGTRHTSWRQGGTPGVAELRFDYRAAHHYSHQGDSGNASIHRASIIRIRGDSHVDWSRGRLTWDIHLEPHGVWRAELEVGADIDGERLEPRAANLSDCSSGGPDPDSTPDRARFRGPRRTDLSDVVTGALERAARDLAALRMPQFESPGGWVPAGGIPMYDALFGRDTLVTSWHAALLGPEMLRGTLRTLARWQGTCTDDWRDEQPGRMLHEAHDGPMEALNYNPKRRSYSSVTSSVLYPVALRELWRWTGDREEVRRLLPAARRAIRWLDEFGDLDGDGFYEYKTHSTQGVENQGWKDSGDAVVYEDGSQVEPPIATCEEQGYAYLAKLSLAEVLWWLGEHDEASQLWEAAEDLKRRFNARFWVQETGFYAFGLGPNDRQIKSIVSNPGHCLAANIVEESRTRRVADRLLAPDMFSGWGVRTLSSEHPSFDPYAYHRGTVWPVEQGAFVPAFTRLGLWDHALRLARAVFEAAAIFDSYRLPECFAGHQRDEDHPFPAMYPRANCPQAWSSACIVSVIQALLGICPYAPLGLLMLDPHLPDWLPEITVDRIRVGNASACVRFVRNGDSTDVEVLDQQGELRIMRRARPWEVLRLAWDHLPEAVGV